MKYLTYELNERVGSGLNDRKCVLSILFEEAKSCGRIAVIPRFKMSKNHNHARPSTSQILGEYLSFDKEGYPYVLNSENTEWNVISGEDDIPDELKYVKRHFTKGVWYNKTWNKYENTSFIMRNTTFKPIEMVKQAGDEILKKLGTKTIGVHVRKGDRLTPNETRRLTPGYIQDICSKTGYAMYVASNEQNFVGEFYTYRDFPEVHPFAHDNYLLFALEMYIVENCDVHIKTFQDSEHLYNSDAELYYMIPRSMHIHDNGQRVASYTPEKKLFEMTSLPNTRH